MALCQSGGGTPWPRQEGRREGGAATVSTHFHTWTNSETRQGKRPTHLCPPPSLPPPPCPPVQKTQNRPSTIGCLLTFLHSALRDRHAALWHARMHSTDHHILASLVPTLYKCAFKPTEKEQQYIYIQVRRSDDTHCSEQHLNTRRILPPPTASTSVFVLYVCSPPLTRADGDDDKTAASPHS